MGRSRARSAQIGGPEGISQVFQVSTNSGEPFTSILARNLLSKDFWKSQLGDEIVKSGPEVSFVGMALVRARARKRLTGTGAGPDGATIGPAGKSQGVGPAADPGEEMALDKASEVSGFDIDNAPLVYFARRDMARGDQVAQPSRREGVVLVVVGAAHAHNLFLVSVFGANHSSTPVLYV